MAPRKRLLASELRKKHTVGLADAERDYIDSAARMVGRTRARFIREAALTAAGFAMDPRPIAPPPDPPQSPMALARWKANAWRAMVEEFGHGPEGEDGVP